MQKYNRVDEVRDRLLADIRAGMMEPGEELATVRTLCLRYDTCTATMSKVLGRLHDDGIVSLSQGRKTVLRRRLDRRIALIYYGKIEMPYSEYGGKLYRGIDRGFSGATGYTLALYNAGVISEAKLRESLGSDYVGYIIVGRLDPDSAYRRLLGQRLQAQSLPLVQFGCQSMSAVNCSTVYCDYGSPFRKLLQGMRCAGLGHPLVVNDPRDVSSHKHQCFLQAYEEVFGGHLPAGQLILARQTDHLDAYGQLLDAIRSSPAADAVIALADDFLVAVARAVHDCGRKMAFSGCDNLASSRLVIPSATTIDLHLHEAGGCIAREMLGRLAAEHPLPPKTVTLDSEVIFRESTPRWQSTPK